MRDFGRELKTGEQAGQDQRGCFDWAAADDREDGGGFLAAIVSKATGPSQ